MKRDWDVIQEVLSEVENLNAKQINGLHYDASQDESSKSEHAILLWKAGFIEGIDASGMNRPYLLAQGLTWDGHELLDTIKSKPVWEKIKKTAVDRGVELTFDSVRMLGSLALKAILNT
ncbi:UNVERIFIED_ORG: hypothetical protein HNP28_002344 [Comamonas terrigena]